MDPTTRFAVAVSGPKDSVALDEAAFLIAAHAHPGLDVAAQRARLDDLAASVRTPTLDGVRALIFDDLGFRGNRLDYYDARNSYLDDVLDRRLGIPISLAVVTLEVGRRVGVPLDGVSMPGHFLLRDKVDPDVFVDAFAGGAVLDRWGCETRFRAVHGEEVPFDARFLAPVGRLAIVARMLANLEAIAARTVDRAMLAWVLRLRLSLPGAAPSEHRRLASVLSSMCDFVGAAGVLEGLASQLPDPHDAEEATARARLLRSRLN
ncbi:MAG: SirB1 family protein [Acidimicrobiales bacterium]